MQYRDHLPSALITLETHPAVFNALRMDFIVSRIDEMETVVDSMMLVSLR